MKKLFASAVAVVLFAACADEKQAKSLRITGNIEGFKKGTLYIKSVEDTILKTLDSIVIDGDSRFVSDIELKSPEMLYLFIDRGVTKSIDNSLMIFAEPGQINVETTLDLFYSKAKITGSKNHDLYEEFKKIDARFKNQELGIVEEKLNAFTSKKAYDTLAANEKSGQILKRRYLSAIMFALNHKDKEIAPYIALAEINHATIPYLDTIHKSLTPQVADSKYGKLLKQYIADRRKSGLQ